MKPRTLATGICAVLVIATIFIAGCTSPDTGSAPDAGAAPQDTQTIAPAPADSSMAPSVSQAVASAPVPDQGTLDSAGNAGTDSAAVADDAAVDPYNSTSQPATMTPDSEDLGDPIP